MVVVDDNPFYYAAIGGIILGIATSLNYCLRGKVTGMSGIVYGIAFWHRQDIPEKITIIGGMLVAAGMFFDIFQYGTYNHFTPFGPEDQITRGTSYVGFGVAGLLVGFGTKLGNGCTSGHGLCGLSRLSMRSFVAVMCFLASALVISTIRYHVTLGALTDQSLNPQLGYQHMVSANVCIGIGVILPFLGAYFSSTLQGKNMNKWQIFVDELVAFLTGFIFGIGLLVAGMVRRSNILGFLGLGTNWNPSLMFVLGCGVIVNLIAFNYMLRVKKFSYLGHNLFNPQGGKVDWKLVLGASCFGLGWGIGGLCPGPAIMHLAIFTVPVHVIWFGFLLIGMFVARRLEHYLTQSQKEEKAVKDKVQADSKVHSPHKHSLHYKHHHPHTLETHPDYHQVGGNHQSRAEHTDRHHVHLAPIGHGHEQAQRHKIDLENNQILPAQSNESINVEIQLRTKTAKVLPEGIRRQDSSLGKQKEQEHLPTIKLSQKFRETNISTY